MTLDATVSGAASDTYITLAEWETYASNAGWVTVGTDAVKEVYLRRAAQYLDRSYRYVGYRNIELQARAWPRQMDRAIDGYWVDDDVVPQDIKDAQAEMAWLIHGGADPFATLEQGGVKSTSVKAGEVESTTVYDSGRAVPRYQSIDGLLSRYLASGAGQVQLRRG